MTDDFWQSRDSLRHVRDFARGRRVCPWSTLGAVLVRAVCHIPPHVNLPPLVGGRTSLNLFCALVGPSGVGKGGSESAARDAITFTGTTIEALPELPLGSGEGIARAIGDDSDMHTALFTAPEIDSLGALFARQGATLEGELRKVWTGESLGFTNAQKATRTHAERLSYRAGVIAGVQPLRAHVLLQGADGGTPQRFIWLPVLDPQRPTERPGVPEPMAVEVPEWLPGELAVPDVACRAIDEHQAAIHRQDPDIDPLAGHSLLCRLKVAVALMALDSRDTLSDDDWHLAGNVMAVSDQTRSEVEQAAAAKARQTNRARALAGAERDEVVSEHKHQRARKAVLRKIDSTGQQSKNQLRMAMKNDIRDYLDAALSELIEGREIAVSQVQRGGKTVHMYHRYIDQKHGATSVDDECTESTYVPTPLEIARARPARQRQRTRGKHQGRQQTRNAEHSA